MRAHAIGVGGLTDDERIALGATLIMTVLTPGGQHRAVGYAAAKLREHSAALLDAEYYGFVMADVAQGDVP